MLRFLTVDTLSGKIVGRLYPTTWELSDPLRTPGTGQLVLPKPPAGPARQALIEATRPRTRWVAVQDEQTSQFLWGGPIPKRPSADDSTVSVPLVDWRSWFYRAPLRPVIDELGDATTGDYIVKDRDQTLIADDLFRLALTDIPESPLKVPPMIVDAPVASGLLRERTARQLDGSIGTTLDTLVDTERGLEWWTYVTADRGDPTRLQVHVTTAYPERSTGAAHVRLEWRKEVGGNASEATWPEASEASTRVWAVGDGEPPAQAWAYDEDVDAEVVWEETIGPLDGVKKSATAYDHAFAHLQRSRGYEAFAEFVVPVDRLAFSRVEVGARARARYSDGWQDVEVEAARVVERVLSGGAGQPTQQKLVLDLADTVPPESEEEPGVPGVEEETE